MSSQELSTSSGVTALTCRPTGQDRPPLRRDSVAGVPNHSSSEGTQGLEAVTTSIRPRSASLEVGGER